MEKIGKMLARHKYADAVVSITRFSSIVLKDGEVENVREGSTENLSCRVLANGSFGFASTNQLGKAEETIKQAERLAKLKGGSVKIAEPEIRKSKIKTKIKDDPLNHSLEEKIRLLREFEKLSKLEKTSNSQIIYHDSNSMNYFLNSAGAEIEEHEIRTGAAANIFAKEGNLIENSFEQVKEKCGFEIMKRFPEKVGKAAREANELLAAKHGPKGKMIAVLDPELAGVFAHEAVGHACEADAVKNESSCLQSKLGTKIGSEHVVIKDSPVVSPELWGSYEYDDEGSKAKGTILVKNGILNAYLTNLESASEFNGKLTGNGRGDLNCRQIVRMSNTYFEKGDYKPDDLFEGINYGVYLVGCKEGQVSPKIGNFTFAAKYGFIIKNGEKNEMIRDCSINGNILQSLHHIDAVAKDLEFLPGTCGKDGQNAPVTTGAPHLRIKEILVG